MGTYLLCSSPLAKHPLKTRELGIDLYSAEELCYYIYHNFCVLEEDFVNKELLSFIDVELNLTENAVRIRRYAEDRPPFGMLLLYILREFRYYSDVELKEFQVHYEEFRKNKPMERKLIKADFLLEQGRILAALNIYHQFEQWPKDQPGLLQIYFRAKQHMAIAYAKLGLYQEAMAAYLEAFRLCPGDELLMRQMFTFSCFSGIPLPADVFHVMAPVMESKWRTEYEEAVDQARMYASTGSVAAIFTKDAVRRKELIADYIEEEKRIYRRSIQ